MLTEKGGSFLLSAFFAGLGEKLRQ